MCTKNFKRAMTDWQEPEAQGEEEQDEFALEEIKSKMNSKDTSLFEYSELDQIKNKIEKRIAWRRLDPNNY